MDLNAKKIKQILGSSILLTGLVASNLSYADDVVTAEENPLVHMPEAAVDQGAPQFGVKPVAVESAVEAKPEEASRMLPIWGNEARAKGYDIPEPFGVGYNYMRLHQDIIVDKIGFIGSKKNSLAKALSIEAGATTQISETHLARVDAWLFPFMNVYGLLGKTKGRSTTTLEGGSYKVGLFPIQLPIKGMPFNLEFEGDTYGAGTTFAGGYKNFFTMLDVNYTYADLNILDGDIKALVVTPRIGYSFDLPPLIAGKPSKLQLWTGAMYQDITQSFEGNVLDLDLSPGVKAFIRKNDPDMKFSVDQHLAHQWNALVGARLEITPHFNLTTEVGFNTRKTFMFSGEYRF